MARKITTAVGPSRRKIIVFSLNVGTWLRNYLFWASETSGGHLTKPQCRVNDLALADLPRLQPFLSVDSLEIPDRIQQPAMPGLGRPLRADSTQAITADSALFPGKTEGPQTGNGQSENGNPSSREATRRVHFKLHAMQRILQRGE